MSLNSSFASTGVWGIGRARGGGNDPLIWQKPMWRHRRTCDATHGRLPNDTDRTFSTCVKNKNLLSAAILYEEIHS